MTYRQSLLTLLFTSAVVGCVYVAALRFGGYGESCDHASPVP